MGPFYMLTRQTLPEPTGEGQPPDGPQRPRLNALPGDAAADKWMSDDLLWFDSWGNK